jgi:predicted outer membrane repeat protein
MSRRLTFCVATLLLSLLFLTACNNDDPPEITYTPGCSVSELIDAINDANDDPGTPAIINLDPNCPYVLTSADNSIGLSNHTFHSGLPRITSEITINGNNAVIDIQGTSPVFGHFFVESSGDLELYDLTLQNGRRLWGGAVIVFEGDFFASRTSFLNNAVYPEDFQVVGLGGAIYNDSGRVRIIDNSLFQGNLAGETTTSGANLGGAIYSKNGQLLVASSTFDSNYAAGSGGAIYSGKDVYDESGGVVQISETSFSGNTALRDGGAIVLNGETNGVFIVTSDFSDNEADDSGGAIYSEASDLTVNFDTFSFNQASLGGAIYSKRQTEGSPSSLFSKRSTFGSNAASEIGGAIFSENSDVTLEGSTIANNSAESCGGFRNGGSPSLDIISSDLNTAMRVSSISEITGGSFYLNVATVSYGGAICHVMGDMSIRDARFQNNQAVTMGGGLLLLDESELSGLSVAANSAARGGGAAVGYPGYNTPCEDYWLGRPVLSFNTSISNSHFAYNQSSCGGGGIWVDVTGWVNLTKSTINNNTTDYQGGGIYQLAGNLNIKNSTFSENSAIKGGGLYTNGINPSLLRINHSTFAYNIATETSGDVNNRRWGGGGINVGGNADIKNTLFTQNSSIDCQLENGMSYTTSGVVDSDGECAPYITEPNPEIGPLSDNGGSTPTHALLPISPLIDVLSDCAGITDDQRDIPRPLGFGCDPGSYEFEPIVDPPAPPPPAPDPGPETSTTSRCDLFEGLEFSLVLLDIPQETTDLTLYLKIPGGVPGLELEIPGDTSPWIYRALLGDTESAECSILDIASGRLYCDFTLPAAALGSAQNLQLYLNECDDSIISLPRVSIPESQSPTCSENLDEESCIATGGTFYQLTDTESICSCP